MRFRAAMGALWTVWARLWKVELRGCGLDFGKSGYVPADSTIRASPPGFMVAGRGGIMHHRRSLHHPTMFLASLFLEQGIQFSLGCALVGLLVAGVLIKMILGASAGNEKMQEIARAVQAGARAYLNRQVRTIVVIAVVAMGLVFWAKGVPAMVGFVIGAGCSLAAGYIGMMIAVRANVRTTQAASVGIHPALKIAQPWPHVLESL